MDKIDEKPYSQKMRVDYLSAFARGDHERTAHNRV